jgi:hypothetical protein
MRQITGLPIDSETGKLASATTPYVEKLPVRVDRHRRRTARRRYFPI